MRSPLPVSVLFAAALAEAGCSRPEPPRLTPESATVSALDVAGLGLDLALDAYNPNRVALEVREVTAKISIDQRSLGTVTAPTPFALKANDHTHLKVPLRVGWNDAAALVTLTTAGHDVPYVVEGNVTLGGSVLSVSLPFRLQGTVTQAQLRGAAIRSIPGLSIPGLSLP